MRVAAIIAVAVVLTTVGAAAQPFPRAHSALERSSLERLEAAHQDVVKLRASWTKPENSLTNLTDYRAIFHAHAEDSAHTGGTLPEILEDAKKMDVSAIFLSDHFRPPRDFIDGRWRGVKDGVLFVPGSETHGWLVHPVESVLDKMELPPEELLPEITEGKGMAFLSHVESRVDHPMAGLTGMEIYNRHADASDDNAALFAIVRKMTEPEGIEELTKAVATYPQEILAFQCDYPELYLEKWDNETQNQRVVGVAANDCHHNQVFLVKKVDDENVRVGTVVDDDDEMRVLNVKQFPGVAEITKGHAPGDVIAQFDFDPYWASFHNVSTHIFAPELTEDAVRDAVLAGHVYVSHDWMCDPAGFAFAAHHNGEQTAFMGDEVDYAPGTTLRAAFPVPCAYRLLKNGEDVARDDNAAELSHPIDGPGVYRLEGWLEVDGEKRIWIYSNPIYVR